MRTRDIALLALAGSGTPAPRTEYVTRTVHEHRAPTDESVKILKEMEEAAWKKVADTIAREANNYFDVITFKLEKNPADRLNYTYALFSLNGKTIEMKLKLDEHEAGKMFWDAIAKEIAEQITAKMCDGFMATKFRTT
jgi:hypothetical protein